MIEGLCCCFATLFTQSLCAKRFHHAHHAAAPHALLSAQDIPSFPEPLPLPSQPRPTHEGEPPQDVAPCSAGPFGRSAVQSPRTGYEPNPIVEISSTEATPVIPTSWKSCSSSTQNSGEQAITVTVFAEVDEGQSADSCLAAAHEGESSTREHSLFQSPQTQGTGRGALFTQTKVRSRPEIFTGESARE